MTGKGHGNPLEVDPHEDLYLDIRCVVLDNQRMTTSKPRGVDVRSQNEIDTRLRQVGLEDVDRVAFYDALLSVPGGLRGGTPNGVLGMINDAVVGAADQLGLDTPASHGRFQALRLKFEGIVRSIVLGDEDAQLVLDLDNYQSNGARMSYEDSVRLGDELSERVTVASSPGPPLL